MTHLPVTLDLPAHQEAPLRSARPLVWVVLRSIAVASVSIVLALVILSNTLRAYADIIGAPHSIALWDFKLFYSGDLDFFAGGSLYRPSAVLPFPRISISPNNNSPVGALIFLPFSRLPLPVAALVWESGSLLLLLVALGYMGRILRRPRQRWLRALLVVCVYVSFPITDALWLGTWGMLIAALDIMAWCCARQGAQRRAGIFLGLALALRWQPLVILLYMIAQRRWRVVTYTLVTGAVCSAGACVVFGVRSFVEFARMVATSSTGGAGDPYDGTVRAAVGRLIGAWPHTDPHLVALIAQGGLLSALGLLALTLWRGRSVGFDVGFSLAIVCGFLVVPMSWMHYDMALLLPMAVVAQRRAWPALCVGLFWLSVRPLSLDTTMPPGLFGTILTVSLVVLYVSLWHQSSPRYVTQHLMAPTSDGGRRATPV